MREWGHPRGGIGDVVRFSETDLKLIDCTSCVIKGSCGLISILCEARNAFLGVLDRYSIADAASDKDRLRATLFRAVAA